MCLGLGRLSEVLDVVAGLMFLGGLVIIGAALAFLTINMVFHVSLVYGWLLVAGVVLAFLGRKLSFVLSGREAVVSAAVTARRFCQYCGGFTVNKVKCDNCGGYPGLGGDTV